MSTVIQKSPADCAAANMPDYQQEAAAFTWNKARDLLDGMEGNGLNIAYEAVDRHVANGYGETLALRWIAKDGRRVDYSYRDLMLQSNRFANLLRRLGVNKGDTVCSLLGRVPALYIAVLGTLKAGCVYSPMFSAFGPEPVKSRMQIGEAKVLITSSSLYRRKVSGIRDQLPALQAVLLTDTLPDKDDTGLYELETRLEAEPDHFECEATEPEDGALLHFTSGTTGKPKGALHVHEAVVAHHYTGKVALDLKRGDVFWCTADPGWVTGTSYGIIAPLSNGVSMIVDEAEFDVSRWYGILASEQVNVWYTAPTAIRMLMKAGSDLPANYDLSALRFMASVGEPLNPEAVTWSHGIFGMPFHDNWWQTETGGIMIANYASMGVKPGSMGKPLPGIEAGIVSVKPDGLHEEQESEVIGELALKRGWPSMMRAYLGEEERYKRCFMDGWYLTGDLAMRDAEGYYWFVGRSDDLIKSAGHLIGPFEVESALMEHESVAEVGVIGIPDDTAGEIVKAFVALKPGFEASDQHRLTLIGHARKRLGPAVAPKEIEFRSNLPKTRSGKIMRRLLKARELGLPEGDISTLETDEQ